MGWLFSLCVECNSEPQAEALAKHFTGLDLLLPDGRKFDCQVSVHHTEENSSVDWWCNVYPQGISECGVHTFQDAYMMTELGHLLYQREFDGGKREKRKASEVC